MNDQELTFYYFPISYFSQRARFYLEEKGVPYKKVFIALHLSETYEPWYMRMNPNGQVPVLQHGERYVSDSLQIIAYLEEQFRSPRLIPDESTAEGRSCRTMCQLCEKIEIEVLTYYTWRVSDPRVKDGELPRWPLAIFSIFSSTTSSKMDKFFTDMAKKYPDLHDAYLAKREYRSNMGEKTKDKDLFNNALKDSKAAFDAAEKQLERNAEEGNAHNWLCSTVFSAADIELALLMRRLKLVGLSKHTWDNGSYPYLERYYERLLNRKSFQNVCMPPVAEILKEYSKRMLFRCIKKTACYSAIGIAVAGIGYLGYYVYTKTK